MKKSKKYCVNLEEETADLVERLARVTRRKSAEVLRLIIEDHIIQTLATASNLNPSGQPFPFVKVSNN